MINLLVGCIVSAAIGGAAVYILVKVGVIK